ncbi:MAG: hypothetical protein H0W50_09920 [Parachlamydiaceae bacterium]|nr:hypothetical protein [Parachlamydiaceae bacterium]
MQINACGNQPSNYNAITNSSIGFEVLPMDVVREITNYADFDASKNLSCVSKAINNVISIRNVKRKNLIKETAFGKEEWLKFYDLDTGIEPMLPRDIIEILNSPCYMDPTRSLKDTHILTLIPKDVSVKSFGELAKKYFPISTGYAYAFEAILEKLVTPNDKSYWALMSKDVLNGSRGECFETQYEMVGKLSQHAMVNCEVPSALEAAISILTHQVRLGERLFSDNPEAYTYCLEAYNDYQVFLGGFASAGLSVSIILYNVSNIGVAVMRKFRPLVIG